MTTQTQTINVLEDAQDILPLYRAETEEDREDVFVYAAKPSLSFQRIRYDTAVSNLDREIPAFSEHFEFDKEKGITGSSTPLNLNYEIQALRPLNLWLPGFKEGRRLDIEGKLENVVYRDYGIIVLNDGKPSEIAERLSSQAYVLGLELPLIVPYKALNQNEETGMPSGLVQNPEGIIYGNEAQEALSDLDFVGNSGLRRLGRDWGGDWDAYWDDLLYSNGDGRVDWICGEATRADLEQAHDGILRRMDDKKIRELELKRQKKLSRFEKALTR